MVTSKIRVLIVDDSPFYRMFLEKGLMMDPGIEVIGVATDTFDAMRKIKAQNPDVVTLDVEMPGLNGIDFLKWLIPIHPVAVVVVSSVPMQVFDALEAGAVDFVRKPSGGGRLQSAIFLQELRAKVAIAANARVVKRPRPAPTTARAGIATSIGMPTLTGEQSSRSVIAIGASTGGTDAILAVVEKLPRSTPGIVVVQHMPPGFTEQYAGRLNNICQMQVKEARHLDRVIPGRIIIAAGDFHLTLCEDGQGYYVTSKTGPKVSGHCPSVNVLFESVAKVGRADAIGVILTGMGGDGAEGLLSMHKAGAYTIGQDEETCVVYGMPHVAYKLGAVSKQMPLQRIGPEIIRVLNTRRCTR